MMDAKRKRVLVADDHPIFRQGLVRAIQETAEFEVIGEAADGRRALDLLGQLRPDMAVVDIAMPVMDGLDVIRGAGAQSLGCDFIIMTMYREEEYFREALDLGVRGYLLKESAAGDLIQCLRAVAGGKHYVCPAMSEYLILASTGDRLGARSANPLESLSRTERRVLRLIADNRTSREIADELHISFRTVQNHRAHMCEKLRLEGFNKLLQFALEHKSLL
jgi:DNA-binding NarL/FixJ family response regulator